MWQELITAKSSGNGYFFIASREVAKNINGLGEFAGKHAVNYIFPKKIVMTIFARAEVCAVD